LLPSQVHVIASPSGIVTDSGLNLASRSPTVTLIVAAGAIDGMKVRKVAKIEKDNL